MIFRVATGLKYVVMVWLSCAGAVLAQEGGQTKTPPAPGESPASEPVNPDEAAVRESIDSLIKAFNAHDAKAFAAHWQEQGESVAPDGSALQGRERIQEEFTEFFKNASSAKIELVDSSIAFLSPNVAVETGAARITVGENERGDNLYEVIRVRTADGWKIDSLREHEIPEPPPSNYERLKGLEWMIGSWIDDDEDSTLESSVRWSTNQNFLIRSFRVLTAEGVDFEGTDVIGWDPQRQVIRSWLFDSDGGFGVGVWEQNGNRWTVRSRHVTPDGSDASSTSIYDVQDDGSIQFQSIGRQVGGELLPQLGPVRVVRGGN